MSDRLNQSHCGQPHRLHPRSTIPPMHSPTRTLTRRDFLRTASAASLAVAGPNIALAAPAPLRGRFLTHISVVRVNQIEVTPTRNIGQDEAPDNRPERIRSRRDAFSRGCPNGKMTWAISWLALKDQRKEYQEARKLLASYHDRYGDEITFIPGGYFAPMYNIRENIRRTINDALAPRPQHRRRRLSPPIAHRRIRWTPKIRAPARRR